MTVSGTYEIEFVIKDQNGNELVKPPLIEDARNHDQYCSFQTQVASGASFASFPFGPVTTCKLLILQSTEEVTVKINGDANIIFLVKELLIIQNNTGFTQIDIKNESGTEATVTGYVLGA